ncbi:MAG: HlyD family efflux transporter periplasmic adaptor subunit [Flavobacteriaceae bacterium]|nr:HlyD family efflux transporter periplasmic adaptor subunit [Flavobacteriaceae bacterium]
MRKILLFVIGAVIIIVSIIAGYYIYKSNNQVLPPVAKVVKTVYTEEVKNGTVPIVIPANGNLVAKNRLELYSEVQGVFQSSSHDFKPGQSYRQGEILINIDASEYYASVQSAKSNLYNLITSIMPDLRLDYPDAFPTWQAYLNNFKMDQTVPPLPETNNEQINYFISGRGIATSYYNVKNLEQRLSKYIIRAPFSGVLTEALVTRGTLIRPGQKLGEFIDTGIYELELAIGKNFSDLLQIGEKVELKSLEGNNTYVGRVARINGRIDQTTQTIKVFVEVEGESLKEGMYLEAELEAREEPNAIKISRKLLVNDSEIFYVKEDSILGVMKVNPVYFSPDNVVVKGIEDGTEILSRPLTGAYPGMLVKVSKEDNPGTASSNPAPQ